VDTKEKWRAVKHKYSEMLSVFKNYLKRSVFLCPDWFNGHQIKVFRSYLIYAVNIFPDIQVNKDFPLKHVL
jgi:uncharacterized membrane protein